MVSLHDSSPGIKGKRKGKSLRTQFPELAICDEQSAQSSQPLKSFILVSRRSVLGQRSVWRLEALGIVVRSLPDKVLNQVAVILGQQKLLCELHNLSRILY